MYEIIYHTDCERILYKDRAEWEEEIEYIAENTPCDIDVIGFVCFVDDGDCDDELASVWDNLIYEARACL